MDMQVKALQFIRDSLLSKQSLDQRRDTLTVIKAVKAGSSALGFVALLFGILDLREGRLLGTIGSLTLSYGMYEVGMIADNCREVLENPFKEAKAICAKIHSDEEFWKFIAKGAPLTRKIGAQYLAYVNPEISEKKKASWFSRFGSRKIAS